jgi:hypothetical protein
MAIFRVAMRSGAEAETKGTLIYNDETDKITLDPPDSTLLLRVMKEKLQIFGEFIDAKEEPRKFIENLQKQYRSPYLSADAPVEDGTDIPIRPGPDAGRA